MLDLKQNLGGKRGKIFIDLNDFESGDSFLAGEVTTAEQDSRSIIRELEALLQHLEGWFSWMSIQTFSIISLEHEHIAEIKGRKAADVIKKKLETSTDQDLMKVFSSIICLHQIRVLFSGQRFSWQCLPQICYSQTPFKRRWSWKPIPSLIKTYL